jgi:protease II
LTDGFGYASLKHCSDAKHHCISEDLMKVGKYMPPRAKRIPYETTIHGKVLRDELSWLRERENPDVLTYLRDANRYTAEMMRDTEKLQEKLYQEMVARIK